MGGRRAGSGQRVSAVHSQPWALVSGQTTTASTGAPRGRGVGPVSGTCAVKWPLQEQWEEDVLAGKLPEV